MGWVQHFDDSDWEEGVNSEWDGTKWIIEGEGGIGTIGTWFVDYRPLKIRITFENTDTIDIEVYSSPPFIAIAEVDDVISGQEVSLSFVAGRDIGLLDFLWTDGEDIHVTNIEFLEEETACSESLDGMLLQIGALEHYVKTLAPSLYGINTKNTRQMIDLDAKIPDLQDSDLARRNADYFRKLPSNFVHWTRYDKEARRRR